MIYFLKHTGDNLFSLKSPYVCFINNIYYLMALPTEWRETCVDDSVPFSAVFLINEEYLLVREAQGENDFKILGFAVDFAIELFVS